jgi:thioester reductase-like protein
MRPPVFLTGATGFLGMEVLARLLERGDREVIVLVRARDNEAAAERIDGVLAQLWRDPA